MLNRLGVSQISFPYNLSKWKLAAA